ncbi:FAD-dependent oxidoreductase [Roseibium sp. LAB1]
MTLSQDIAIVGAGIAGSIAALELADRGNRIVLYDAAGEPLTAASFVNEGKIHLGFVYGGDRSGLTARRMIDGALQFRSIVSRWVGQDLFASSVTRPFDYAVPEGSQLSAREVEQHFQLVQEILCEQLSARNADYLGEVDLPSFHRLISHPYGSEAGRIEAAFATPERSVDTHIIAGALRAAVLTHPLIDFQANHKVNRFVASRSGWQVVGENGTDGPFGRVLNAAWGQRRFLDHASGFPDDDTWFLRYKMAVLLPDCLEYLANVTFMLGRYGDLVRYDAGRVYLSWYPAMMLASTRDLLLTAPKITPSRKVEIVRESVAAIAAYYPEVAQYLQVSEIDEATLIGGIIDARGASDIDDRVSDLHKRSRIGPSHLAEGYCSLDPGKYTTAPMLALEAANDLALARQIYKVSSL